jgi:carbonyl reductase 1
LTGPETTAIWFDMRRIVVTGGNRGLGLETCRQLARKGAHVVLAARDPEEAAKAAASLSSEGTVSPGTLDVVDERSIAAFAEACRSYGPLHGLVNNAGASFSGFDGDVARRTLDTNLRGPLRITDALQPLLEPGATVVMVSSQMGDLSVVSAGLQKELMAPDLDRAAVLAVADRFVRAVSDGKHERLGFPSNAYSVSKLLLNALTRVLARELQDLRVNAVCPGWVKTRMGGRSAPRSVEEGASGITWAALLGVEGPTGGLFRDGQPIDW